jgi:serine protease AprX
MNSRKLEPRLANLVEERRAGATERGLTAADVEAEPISVTISHEESVRAEEGRDPDEALEALEEGTRQSQAPIMSKLEELGAAEEATQHTLTNAVTTKLTPQQMAEVAELDEVQIIRLETIDHVTCMNESARVIETLLARKEFKANGKGVRVAILDSGVDASHPALTARVVDQVETVGESVNIPGNHGTHVAGTVAGNDAVFRGIAPQADLINVKVLTAAGGGTPTSAIAGLQQAVRRKAKVVNLSLGWSEVFHGWTCNDADCILCQAADNAVRLGVTVVVAAGNEDSASTNPGIFNVRHPGAAKSVITVAAVDKNKKLANFSSIGPGSGRLSPGTNIRVTKPDVSAPGVNIFSSVVGGGFGGSSGTSMASPHVAGLAALMLQKAPKATPMKIKKLMEHTCEPLTYSPDEVGYGLVNVYAALMHM